MRNVEIHIRHNRIESVQGILPQQLVAENSFGCGEPVVFPIDAGQTETPVEMVRLYCVGYSLEVQCRLIEGDRVGFYEVSGGRIRKSWFVRAADIEAKVDPPIDLDLAGLPPFAMWTISKRGHQRRQHCVWLPDHRRAAIWPHSEWKRRIGFRGRISPVFWLGPAHAFVMPVVDIRPCEPLPESPRSDVRHRPLTGWHHDKIRQSGFPGLDLQRRYNKLRVARLFSQ